jgi:hypothetical protein
MLSTDLIRCCQYPIWGDMWMGTDVQKCCHDLIWSAICIGNYVTDMFHDQFEVLFGRDQMIEIDVMT